MTRGQGNRPVRHKEWEPKPRSSGRQTVIVQQAAAQIDMDALLAAARAIGQSIAAEMRKVQPQVIIQEGSTVQRSANRSANSAMSAGPNISIDEGIADVGIGHTQALKKGAGAGDIAGKGEDTKDKAFTSTRNKLRRLKRS